MLLDVRKVVDKKVKNHLQWVKAMNHLLVEKIIFLVEKGHLQIMYKMKKIVQTIHMLRDVSLQTENKNHLQWVKAMNHLLVMRLLLKVVEMNHLLVIPGHLLVIPGHLLVIPGHLLPDHSHYS